MKMAKQEFVTRAGCINISEWIDNTADRISEILNENNDFTTQRLDITKLPTYNKPQPCDRFDVIHHKGEEIAWMGITQSRDPKGSSWSKTLWRDDSIQITLILKKEYKNTSSENGWVIPERYKSYTNGINDNASNAQNCIISIMNNNNNYANHVRSDDFAIKYVVSRQGKINMTKFREILETLKKTAIDKHYVDGLDNFVNMSEFSHASVIAETDMGAYTLSFNKNKFGVDDAGRLNKVVHSTACFTSPESHIISLHNEGSFKFNVEDNTYSNLSYQVTHKIIGSAFKSRMNIVDTINEFREYSNQFNSQNNGYVISTRYDMVINQLIRYLKLVEKKNQIIILLSEMI